MKKLSMLFLGSLAIAASLPAQAQWTASGLYFGAAGGKSASVNACALAPAPCESKRDTSFSFFAGYDLTRFLGIEAGYNDFGKVTVGGANIKSNASDLVAVLHLPLERRFSAYGKAGVYHGETKAETIDQRKNGATYGLGLQYDAGTRVAIRTEWQRFSRMAGGSFADTTNMDYYNVGVLIRIP